jgi:hypothetical protein
MLAVWVNMLSYRRLKPTRTTPGARVAQGAATPSMRSNLTTMRPNC